MTVSFTMQRLSDLTDLLGNGIKKSPSTIQSFVNDADLPTIVLIPGPAVYDYRSSDMPEDMVKIDRVWRLLFLYSRVTTGTTGQNQLEIAPLMDVISLFFIARPGLWLDNATQPEDVDFDSHLGSDTGYAKFEYAKEQYEGCQWDLHVSEIVPVIYVD